MSARVNRSKLINQGMILGEVEFTGYKDGAGAWVSASDVAQRRKAEYSQAHERAGCACQSS